MFFRTIRSQFHLKKDTNAMLRISLATCRWNKICLVMLRRCEISLHYVIGVETKHVWRMLMKPSQNNDNLSSRGDSTHDFLCSMTWPTIREIEKGIGQILTNRFLRLFYFSAGDNLLELLHEFLRIFVCNKIKTLTKGGDGWFGFWEPRTLIVLNDVWDSLEIASKQILRCLEDHWSWRIWL